MNSCSHEFLAIHDLILLPKIQSGIARTQTARKTEPSTLNTDSAPSFASQSFTKYVCSFLAFDEENSRTKMTYNAECQDVSSVDGNECLFR